MDAVGQEHVQIALRHVRAGVADLVRRPSALEGAQDLAWRAGIDADALGRTGRPEAPKHREDFGQRVRLQREAQLEREAGRGERCLDAPSMLGEAGPVVDEQRRAMLTGQRLRVRTGDPQPPVFVDIEAGAHPPRC